MIWVSAWKSNGDCSIPNGVEEENRKNLEIDGMVIGRLGSYSGSGRKVLHITVRVGS